MALEGGVIGEIRVKTVYVAGRGVVASSLSCKGRVVIDYV